MNLSSDLFKHILANSFEDTVEDMHYLIDNNYIKYHGMMKGKEFLYVRMKDFECTMTNINNMLIGSKHYVYKRVSIDVA